MKSYQVFTNDRRVYNVMAESSQQAIYKAIPTINGLTPTKDKYLANIRTYLVDGIRKSERFYIATYGVKDFKPFTPQELDKLLLHINLLGNSFKQLLQNLRDKGYNEEGRNVPSLKIYKSFKAGVTDLIFLKNAPHDFIVLIPKGITSLHDFATFGNWTGHKGLQCQECCSDNSFWDGNTATRIAFVGGYDLVDTEYLCSFCANIIDISHLHTSNVKSMAGMFRYCDVTHDIIGIEDLNTQNVTNMNAMFMSANIFSVTHKVLNLDNWDFSKVDDIKLMFAYTQFYAPPRAIDSTISSRASIAWYAY